MTSSNNARLGLVLMALLTLLSFFLLWRHDHEHYPQRTHLPEQPTAFLERLSVTAYNASGEAYAWLRAPQAEHWEHSKTERFQNPVLSLRQGTRVWSIRGDAGHMSSDHQRLHFEGHVVLTSHAQEFFELSSSEMDLEPEKGFIYSGRPFKAHSDDHVLEGSDFSMDLHQQLLVLNGPSRGHYARS